MPHPAQPLPQPRPDAVLGYQGHGRPQPLLIHICLGIKAAHGECAKGLRALHGALDAQRLVLQDPVGGLGLLVLRI